jgi:hypothetical protein
MVRFLFAAFVALTMFLPVAGCSRRPAPSRPPGPNITSADVARAIILQYDTKHLGYLDAEESRKSAAIMDLRKDLAIPAGSPLKEEQIAERAKIWLEGPSPRVLPNIAVYLDGERLAGATVNLEPEKCMGADYHACSGITGQSGRCFVRGDDPAFPGVYCGLYRIQVSKRIDGQETIPARYNSKSELGAEVGPSIARRGGLLPLRLKSR